MKSDFKNRKTYLPQQNCTQTDCVRYQELWQEVPLNCAKIALKKLFSSANV